MSHASRFRFRPRITALPGPSDSLELLGLARRLADRPGLALLDPGEGSPAGWGLVAFDPLPLAPPGAAEGLAGLRPFLAALERVEGDAWPFGKSAFAGGFIGALAYDIGVAREQLELPPEPWGWPHIVGGLYTDFILRAPDGKLALVLGEDPGDERPPLAVRREEIFECLARPSASVLEAPRPTGDLHQHVPEEELLRRIEIVRERIAAGELYQANLAHRFTRAMDGHPLALYTSLRECHPSPFQGYLRFNEGALLSASPELFLELDPAGEKRMAVTRPIKGTIARGTDAASDLAAAEQLLASRKDLAELAMIVDLERNDLGRIARAGSVAVEGFPRLESYANVHHLLGDVVAELRDGVDAVDVLTALFPGGSITGAPKLASMELIAELEGEGRGFSYGALGFLDLEGRALFNLLIRSLLWRPGEVAYRVGGGITYASDPAAEVRESWTKGERLARSLEGGAEPA